MKHKDFEKDRRNSKHPENPLRISQGEALGTGNSIPFLWVLVTELSLVHEGSLTFVFFWVHLTRQTAASHIYRIISDLKYLCMCVYEKEKGRGKKGKGEGGEGERTVGGGRGRERRQ